MQLFAVLACVISLIMCPVNAESQTWRIGDDQPFPTHVSTLPQMRRQSILAQIQPSLDKLVKEKWMDSDDATRVKASLLMREASTPSGQFLLVQSWGPELCGGVGNCHVWVLGEHDMLILEAAASELRILKSAHNGRPSILMSLHDSAAERTLVWYRFDGARYRTAACAYKTYGDLTGPYPHPRVEYVPCSEVLQ